jgi:3',5'-nucleoside bisphosphate phosphatase
MEIHAHTRERSDCSHISALDLIRETRDKGLQGIVLTDHHRVWSCDEIRELRRRAGVEPYFVILSGQEVTTDRGDVLVFGPQDPIPKGSPLLEIAQRFPEAALVRAHPYRKGARPEPSLLQSPGPFHGLEIFSSNHSIRDNLAGLQDWHRFKFTALAGTDTHAAGYAGTYPTQFDHWVSTLEDLLAEIRGGRCRPFFKEIPRTGANIQVTEVVVGTKGRTETRERWIIKQLHNPSSWEKAQNTYRILEQVYRSGFDSGPFRVPEPLDIDPQTRTTVEEGQRGKSLFEKLLSVPAQEGGHLLGRVAAWLARLHDTPLRLSPAERFLTSEQRRIRNYLKRFQDCGHPHLSRARAIAEILEDAEKRIVEQDAAEFVQGHGDFHPKNILVGQDQADDRGSLFLSAIDFENSQVSPRAYDVGTFLAQFRNQLYGSPEVLTRYREEDFLEAYHRHALRVPPDFLRQVELFRARTHLSIASYLIKVGMGDSPDLWRVLVEAEKALALYCS